MASKSTKNFWGLKHGSLLAGYLASRPEKGRNAHVIVQMNTKTPKAWRDFFVDVKAPGIVRLFDAKHEAWVLVCPMATADQETDPKLRAKPWARIRDAMGPVIAQIEKADVASAVVDLDIDKALLPAAIAGLEIALYRFKRVLKSETPKFHMVLRHKGKVLTPAAVEPMTALGQSVNVARHLVNLAPNDLNPVSYADFAHKFLSGVKGLKVDVWDEKRLRAERMGLLLAVGRGAATPPRLVHVKYRGDGPRAPVAIVGKGITFDTGGVDIKPSAGMRLMKKDMGGSAAALGLVYWAALSRAKVNLDVYLPMAENSVSGESFRPSDVITARSGSTIEIHNTDAEGRLILADAIDVAVTAKDKPRVLIDVATLTGAIKVAIGGGMAGLFSNSPRLAAELNSTGQEVGDLSWIMPLFQRYRSQMNSNFADMVNAVDGFGGAITAALFLEKFVAGVPWAHLDIYAWKDSAEGCWLESGGNGQSVMNLARWIDSQ